MHVYSTDDEEREQQKARLEDDLNVASERLENLVRGVCVCVCVCVVCERSIM